MFKFKISDKIIALGSFANAWASDHEKYLCFILIIMSFFLYYAKQLRDERKRFPLVYFGIFKDL
jgi:hypothetical protein